MSPEFGGQRTWEEESPSSVTFWLCDSGLVPPLFQSYLFVSICIMEKYSTPFGEVFERAMKLNERVEKNLQGLISVVPHVRSITWCWALWGRWWRRRSRSGCFRGLQNHQAGNKIRHVSGASDSLLGSRSCRARAFNCAFRRRSAHAGGKHSQGAKGRLRTKSVEAGHSGLLEKQTAVRIRRVGRGAGSHCRCLRKE